MLTPARRGGSPARVVIALAGVFACALASSSGAASGATSGSVVGATVLSATSLDLAGCDPATSDLQFGSVPVATSLVTATDCSVVFGSSNDTAGLRIYQLDGAGDALLKLSWTGIAIGAGDIAWRDAGYGIQASASNNLQRTVDGGTTWTPFAPGPPGMFWGLGGDASGQRMVALGTAAQYAYSTDGGATWNASTPPVNSIYGAAAFNDGTHVVAVGGNTDKFQYSSNNGQTWTVGSGPAVFANLMDVMWMGGTTYVAVGGASSRVARTTDGGANWTVALTQFADGNVGGVIYYGMSRKPNGDLWMVGTGGRIRTSTDAGATWSTPGASPTAPTASDLNDIQWATNLHGYLYSTTTVYETVDGGANWSPVATPAVATRGSIQPNGRAWAISGGSSMREAQTGAFNDFASGSFDWSSGTSTFGVCLRSITGGATDAAGAFNADSSSIGDEPAVSADCADGNADPWYAVADTTPGALVARQLTPTGPPPTATAHLRFGLRTATGQASGAYRADVVFEVIAPTT